MPSSATKRRRWLGEPRPTQPAPTRGTAYFCCVVFFLPSGLSLTVVSLSFSLFLVAGSVCFGVVGVLVWDMRMSDGWNKAFAQPDKGNDELVRMRAPAD